MPGRFAAKPMPLIRIDHVQLAMPRGGEIAARAFYEKLLGLVEVAKPAELAGRGGCWFERGELRIHLGVETDFRPARKAHPALRASDLDTLIAVLRDEGFRPTQDHPLAGCARYFVDDPFGNRIELIDELASPD